MEYQAKFIEGATIEELEAELQKMYSDLYKYGYTLDKIRIWDIYYTIEVLKTQ